MTNVHTHPFPDFMNVADLLNDEQRMVESSVRSFVQKEIEPRIQESYLQEDFPTDVIRGLADLGTLGANLDGYGLPGMDNISYGLIMKELERCDSGVRSFVSVQGALVIVSDPRLRERSTKGRVAAEAR